MEAILLPEKLYMRRKSFEFGCEVLESQVIEERTALLLKDCSPTITSLEEPLDRFWAREHACYIEVCKKYGHKYVEYLPGREYTYRLVADLVLQTIGQSLVTALEVGCGSAITCHLLAEEGSNVVGLDISTAALRFARQLALDRKVCIELVKGSWDQMPFCNRSFDVVFSLGALEHHPENLQRLFFKELARVSNNLVIVLVPNENSPIFQTMEEQEFSTMPAQLVYPEEYTRNPVNLLQNAEAVGLTILDNSALHIAPPKLIPGKYLETTTYRFFQDLVNYAQQKWSGDALTTWWHVEKSVDKVFRSSWGWFKYIVCSTQ